MANYNGYGKKVSTLDTTHTWWNVKNNSTAVDRLRVYYIEHHSGATADNAYAGYVNRTTAAGTAGTSFTPIPLDPADGTSNATFDYAHSAEPTYTAGSKVLSIGGHQRSVFQWYAPPGGEIVIPNSNSNGVGFIPADTMALTTEVDFCAQWYE